MYHEDYQPPALLHLHKLGTVLSSCQRSRHAPCLLPRSPIAPSRGVPDVRFPSAPACIWINPLCRLFIFSLPPSPFLPSFHDATGRTQPRDKPALSWQLMNVCALDFPDESFNAVIDKGTLDSVLCGEGSTANVAKMCMEISRVLKPNGVYFICSYGVPDNRLQVQMLRHG